MAKIFSVVFLASVLMVLPSFAEDWAVNGKTFVNVKVTQVDPDRVQITYDGGLGTVNLSDLPPDLQKRFNYVPADGKTVAAQREQAQDAEVAKAQQMAVAEAAKSKAAADAKAYAAALAQQQQAVRQAELQRQRQNTVTIRVEQDHTGESGETAPLSENGGG